MPREERAAIRLHRTAEQLAESWINGNRSDVLNSLSRGAPVRAAALAALVVEGFNSQDRHDLAGALVRRAVEQRR